MIITIKTFASVSDMCGFRERSMDIPDGSTVSFLFRELLKLAPDLESVEARLLFAINEEHCDISAGLRDGDVVAVFPPVSGG